MPPILGWTAMTGQIAAEPLVLFLIIFLWTPPHFWALACYRRDDYARSGLPMLPVTHGVAFTCQHILGYTLMLSNSTPLSIGPFTVAKQPYDPVRQFTHIAMLGVAPVLVMANPKTGPATLKDLPRFYAAFGFEHIALALSTRPPDRAGSDAQWDRAEGALQAVLERLGVVYALQPGAGAFYGPKLELLLRDRAGREWQCGTIQFDLVMPERFDVRYVDASGEKRRPVMLHRALYGSLERFLGIVLEHYGAQLPAWLAPEQVVVIPVADAHAAWAREVADALRTAGLRARIDAREESLARRIAEAHHAAAPFVAVVGAREVAARSLAMRCGREQHVLALADGIALLKERCAMPPFHG
jgi:hypothetical protein